MAKKIALLSLSMALMNLSGVLPNTSVCLAEDLPPAVTSSSEANRSKNLVEQTLDSSASNMGFELKSSLLGLRGSFRTFDGKLLLNPDNFEESQVELNIDLGSASLNFDNPSPAENIAVAAVVAQLKGQKALFQSKKIVRNPSGHYDIQGEIARGGNRWRMDVKAEIVKLDKGNTEFRVQTAGEFSDPSLGSQSLGSVLSGTGKLDSRLIFQARDR